MLCTCVVVGVNHVRGVYGGHDDNRGRNVPMQTSGYLSTECADRVGVLDDGQIDIIRAEWPHFIAHFYTF